LAVAGLAASTAAVPAAAAANPSPARIRAAVRQAVRSRYLWATVNICDTHRYPNYLGVRGEVPTLGFAAWLTMDVRLYYYSTAKHTYLPVPRRGSQIVRLGRWRHGLQQGGALFQFAAHQPTIRASVLFRWRRAGKLLGETTRNTTAGHPSADFGSPPHYSAAQCRIR
jgi:hypothetical protein